MRKLKRPLLLIGFFIFTLHPLYSQLRRKCIDYANDLCSQGNYQGAINYYRKAMELDSSDASLNYSLARSYLRINNYKKAFHYFVQCGRLDRSRDFSLSYHYAGEVDKILGNYPASLKWHRRFIRRYKGDKKAYPYVKSEYELSHIRETSLIYKNITDLELSNEHPVNTEVSEFSPFFMGDGGLFFSSLRSDSIQGKRVMDTSGYYSRIYRSPGRDGQWGEGERVEDILATDKGHVANASVSPGGDYLYYSECNGLGACRIFRARRSENAWVDPSPLPQKINLPGTNNSQPTLARLGGFDVLFFASDRNGGFGQMDIWSCIAYSNGLFSDPVNLGDSVNSVGNELCPFYMEGEQSLYFSSDFYAGLGGFDIFRCLQVEERYRSPENLGIPVNSTYNDLYFRYSDGHAVISSNREGSRTDKFENCCSDLFFFNYSVKKIKRESELSNEEKIQRLLPISLFFENDEPNPRSNDTTTSVLYSASFVNYKLRLSAYEREYSRGLKGEEKENASLEIRNFFDYEIIPSFEDLKQALGLMEEELEAGRHIRLQIKGYASPLSSSDYNRKLTLRRIESVRNEIEYFNGSSLLPYLQDGRLIIEVFPFGEDRASEGVSDDLNDRRNAIYSKRAAFERRVEIISVEIQ